MLEENPVEHVWHEGLPCSGELLQTHAAPPISISDEEDNSLEWGTICNLLLLFCLSYSACFASLVIFLFCRDWKWILKAPTAKWSWCKSGDWELYNMLLLAALGKAYMEQWRYTWEILKEELHLPEQLSSRRNQFYFLNIENLCGSKVSSWSAQLLIKIIIRGPSPDEAQLHGRACFAQRRSQVQSSIPPGRTRKTLESLCR